MAEESLRRSLDAAFDPGPDFPDPRLLSRTMAAIAEADAAPAPRAPASRSRITVLEPARGGRLVAAALIVLLLLAAAGAFVAVQHYFVSPIPAGWRACGGSFQCADVSVPLDYTNPGAGSITIAAVRKPATDAAHRIGALALSLGLPVVSGIDYLRDNSVFYDKFNSRLDLIGFDVRGGGRSAPVRCLTGPETDAINQVDTVLDDTREKQLFIESAIAYAQACEQTSGRVLPFVDTASAARDLDAIRKSLGDSQLTILAFGYGTLLGETYAQLFPSHLRAMVLDGVYDPSASATDAWLQRAAGYEDNLQAFLADCRVLAGCELGTDPAAKLTALLRRVDDAPMTVGSRTLSHRLAISALLLGLEPNNWRRLDAALSDAAGGDGKALLAMADEYYGRQPDGSYAFNGDAVAAVTCLDQPVPKDVSAYDQLGPAMAAASPIFGPAFQYVALQCAYWPAPPRPRAQPQGAGGVPPVLLVGATHDPEWSYAGARVMNRQLPGSVLLTRDGYGTLSYFWSGCVRVAVDAYLLRLSMPSSGTVCASDYPA